MGLVRLFNFPSASFRRLCSWSSWHQTQRPARRRAASLSMGLIACCCSACLRFSRTSASWWCPSWVSAQQVSWPAAITYVPTCLLSFPKLPVSYAKLPYSPTRTHTNPNQPRLTHPHPTRPSPTSDPRPTTPTRPKYSSCCWSCSNIHNSC